MPDEPNDLLRNLNENLEAANKHFLGFTQVISGARVNLAALETKVKAVEKVFTGSTGQGVHDITSAAEAFASSSKVLSRHFTDTHKQANFGFASVMRTGIDAQKHLNSYFTDLSRFAAHSNTLGAQRIDAINAIAKVEGEIKESKGDPTILREQKLRLENGLKLLNVEKEIGAVTKSSAEAVLLFSITAGKVLEESVKYQEKFRSLSLDFKTGLDFFQKVLNATAGTGFVVTVDKAADAAMALRAYSSDFINQSPELIKTVAEVNAVTGLSNETLAGLVYQLKVVTGSTKDFDGLANSMTFFANHTHLGAAEVSELVKEAKPLMDLYPRSLKASLIPQILALGDAFKGAGLDAHALLKTLEDMHDMTSSSGMQSASMISGLSGVSFNELVRGTDPIKAALARFDAQQKWMTGHMGDPGQAATFAALGEKQGLGPKSDLLQAGNMIGDPKERQALVDRLTHDREQAEATGNLNRELQKMLSGPAPKVQALFATINRVFLQVGVNITQGFIIPVTKAMAAIQPIRALYHSFVDTDAPGFKIAVSVATVAFGTLIPLMAVKLVASLWSAITAIGVLVKALNAVPAAAAKAAAAEAAGGKGGGAMSIIGDVLGSLGGKGKGKGVGGTVAKEVEKELEESVAKGASKGFLKSMKGLGGAALGAIASIIPNLLGGVTKFFGTALKFVTGGLIGGLEKIGASALKKMPIVGALIGVGFAINRFLTEPPKNWLDWTQIGLEILSGALAAIPIFGTAGSILVDILNAWIDSSKANTKALDKNTKKDDPKAGIPFAVNGGLTASIHKDDFQRNIDEKNKKFYGIPIPNRNQPGPDGMIRAKDSASFAGDDDMGVYHKARAAGMTDEQAIRAGKGDNGSGIGGINTHSSPIPYFAFPRDILAQQFGKPGDTENQAIARAKDQPVTYKDERTGIVIHGRVGDSGPPTTHRIGKDRHQRGDLVELNPAAVQAAKYRNGDPSSYRFDNVTTPPAETKKTDTAPPATTLTDAELAASWARIKAHEAQRDKPTAMNAHLNNLRELNTIRSTTDPKDSKQLVTEAKANNRMKAEELRHAREQRFIGPSLLEPAGHDTFRKT